ncbi:unnamed protein product [Brugia pahangi]|uniref:Uncharacterized protein n=1 Tax=Brugia pahangi TaxID=6280 RepID=A0A0N4TM81_BRUPA|nr:unnamed protein product [Brugia pahangi]
MGIKKKKTELNFESVTSDLPSITTASAVPITTKQLTAQTVGGEDTYDVITVSPSSSSDGSGNEFVKIEHSDVQQRLLFSIMYLTSIGFNVSEMQLRFLRSTIKEKENLLFASFSVGDTLSFRMDSDGDDKSKRDRRYPVVSC